MTIVKTNVQIENIHPTHSIGDMFLLNGKTIVIIALIDAYVCQLIVIGGSVSVGNRWNEAVSVNDTNRITEEELVNLVHGQDNDNDTIVKKIKSVNINAVV